MKSHKIFNNPNGIILIDKPAKMTSHDVVFLIRKKLREKFPEQKIKVGHAGTLDPLATGLLIVLVGKETKNSNKYMGQDKEYVFNVLFGIKTETGDIDFEKYIKSHSKRSEESSERSERSSHSLDPSLMLRMTKRKIQKSKLEKVLNSLIGKIKLKVPAYSAIKIKGQKLYNLARVGKLSKKDIPFREFKIYDIKLLDFNDISAKIKINCSKGTYIRSIGEEIGKRMGIDSCIYNLRRTKSGNFNIKNAIKLERFLDAGNDNATNG